MIYTVDPTQALYNILKPLAKQIEIYKESMTEDADSTPESYVVIKADDGGDSANVFGDGKGLIRSSGCTINLISKGVADNTTDIHNINIAKIKKLLINSDIAFSGMDIGYDDTIKSTQYTFTLNILYLAGAYK